MQTGGEIELENRTVERSGAGASPTLGNGAVADDIRSRMRPSVPVTPSLFWLDMNL